MSLTTNIVGYYCPKCGEGYSLNTLSELRLSNGGRCTQCEYQLWTNGDMEQPNWTLVKPKGDSK